MIDYESKRLSRLIAILTLLQTKRLSTASELAHRFSVSVRTIYRDIKSLERAGVPVLTQEGKGYALMEGYRLPPVMFTEQEANAIITVEQLIQTNKDTSLVNDYREAATKIKAVLRGSTREKANFLSSRIKIYPSRQPDQASHYLSTLQRALTNYQPVRFQYQSSSNEETTRTVEPFALLMSTQENWVLVAWCRLRKAYRIFRIDRIKRLETLSETFQPHSLTLKEYFETLRE